MVDIIAAMDFLNEASVRELLTMSGIDEHLRLEFKRQLNSGSVAEKAELAKDVAEMCNTPGGGYLLFGFDDNGSPVGINPYDFEADRVAQIITDRCQFASQGIDVRQLKYTCGQSTYDIGVISVPESRFELPASFKDKNGRVQVPIRVGAVTSFLSPIEAIQYYRQKRRLVLPESAKLDLPSMGVYDPTLLTKKSNISFKRRPFEGMVSMTWPAVPVYLPYAPRFSKGQAVLSSNCGTILERDWLTKLAEVEGEIQRHHGILAQCWTIRNWELISPLPKEMDYVLGPSIACLKETMDSGQIREHAYFGWAVLAYRQILYIVSGQLNGALHMRVYLLYIPQSNEFVSLHDGVVSTKGRDLLFTELEGRDIIDWTGITYSGISQDTQKNPNEIPAKLICYIGSPNKPSDFRIRGLTVLRLERITEVEVMGDKKTDLLPVFSNSLLPCYVSSKVGQVNEGKLNGQNAKLSHLVIDCHIFPESESLVYLFTANAGLYYSD